MTWILALLVLSLAGCMTSRGPAPQKVREDDRRKIDNELSQEMSLKADRDNLKEARKEIPEEKQKSNDELALFLSLMRQGKEQPQIVRDKFSSLVQKRRADFRQRVERLRNDYREGETKRREDFMNDQRRKREAYFAQKYDLKENARFTGDLDRDRIRFFGDERDRRTSFDSELATQSKDFESYMHERQNEFNEHFRLYSKQASEQPKAKKAVTGDDFKRMDEVPASPLGTDD